MNGSPSHRCVLLSGATGFLGAQIARRLLHETDLTVIALVRGENQAAAAHRLSRAWWDWPELVPALTSLHSGAASPAAMGAGDAAELCKGVRVEILPGDVSLPHMGLDEATYSR